MTCRTVIDSKRTTIYDTLRLGDDVKTKLLYKIVELL